MNHLCLVVNKRLLRVETSNQMWRRKQFGVQLPTSIFKFSMWHSIIPLETTISFTRHIIICNAVAFPNQVVGGRESLLNKGNFFTDPTTTPLKTSTGQILNFGGHDGSECHLVPLPIRLNRKRFREQIGKCCTAFATTRHSRCDAVISFIWINSSRRSESQAAMTQCNQK